MTNQEAWKIYETYLTGWKAISVEERMRIAADVLGETVQYSTSRHESGGPETVIEDMAAFQKKFPGGHFDVEDVSAHHDVALLTWVLVEPDGTVFAKGHDQIRVSADRKIVSLVTFAPPVYEAVEELLKCAQPTKRSPLIHVPMPKGSQNDFVYHCRPRPLSL